MRMMLSNCQICILKSREKKSRREKDVSVVNLIVGKPSETIGSRTAEDRYGVDEGKRFLENLVGPVEEYQVLKWELREQEGL